LKYSENGILHLAWADWFSKEDNTTARAIAHKMSYDSGNTWTPDTPVVWIEEDATNIDMAVDGDSIARSSPGDRRHGQAE
jgi:hypothetical protein